MKLAKKAAPKKPIGRKPAAKKAVKKTAAKKQVKEYRRTADLPTDPRKNSSVGCIVKGTDMVCPATTGQKSPYRYQQGCRADACCVANTQYYKDLAEEKKVAAAKAAKKKAAAKKLKPKAKK